MIKIIAAVSSNGVIGVNGNLPFHYPEDLKHFKECTLNGTVIMGRKTFDSIGKPLPKRKNIIITSNQYLKDKYPEIETYSSLERAIDNYKENNVWLIGGSSIYQEGMRYADEIVLTITPDNINDDNVEITKFPWINPILFTINKSYYLSDNKNLKCVVYNRIT